MYQNVAVSEYLPMQYRKVLEGERLKLTNAIQQTLMERRIGTTNQLRYLDWIKQNSNPFREFFDAHLKTGFFIGWSQSDEKEMENKIQEIERFIYQR